MALKQYELFLNYMQMTFDKYNKREGRERERREGCKGRATVNWPMLAIKRGRFKAAKLKMAFPSRQRRRAAIRRDSR